MNPSKDFKDNNPNWEHVSFVSHEILEGSMAFLSKNTRCTCVAISISVPFSNEMWFEIFCLPIKGEFHPRHIFAKFKQQVYAEQKEINKKTKIMLQEARDEHEKKIKGIHQLETLMVQDMAKDFSNHFVRPMISQIFM